MWAEIRLDALRRNYRAIRRTLRKGTEVLAIVKAEAYGHGMVPVARALSSEGVKFFGVATIGEALDLRRALPRAGILVLGSFHARHVADYVRARIVPTVSSEEDIAVLEKAPGKGTIAVHAKIDTGMGRLGAWHEDTARFFARLAASKRLDVRGIYTHFSSADTHDSLTRRQMERFERAVADARLAGLSPRYLHAANSMALVRYRKAHLNLVRPGILLYGINPSPRKLRLRLEPVLELKARISFLKSVEPGRTISYGATFKAKRKTAIATLPVGYGHGYRWALSNRSHVLVRGRRCPVVGRVTMDQTLADVGNVPGVRRWDLVTLLGRQGRETVSAEELASLSGTIPYEIVCALQSRIPRIYRGMR